MESALIPCPERRYCVTEATAMFCMQICLCLILDSEKVLYSNMSRRALMQHID